MSRYSYQEPHKDRLRALLQCRRRVLDQSETGTGKTFVALSLAKERNVVPLVVCPRSLIPTWEEAANTLGWAVEAVGYEALRGSGKWETQVGDDGEVRKVRVKLAATDWVTEIKVGSGSRLQFNTPPEFVIFDEAHLCSGSSTLNSKALIAAHRQAGTVMALTATPASEPAQLKALGYMLGMHRNSDFQPRHLPDFISWIQFHKYRPGHFGGWDWTSNKEVQGRVMDELRGHLARLSGKMVRAEIPGFPETRIETKLVPGESAKIASLVEEIAEAYRLRSAQEREADLEENALTKSLRARQALELLKVPSLADLVEVYQPGVAVFLNFIESIKALAAILKKRGVEFDYVVGDGAWETLGIAPTDREDALFMFQHNRLPALLVSASAGDVGLSMHDKTGAKTVRTMLISPGNSPVRFRQILGRGHREGGGFCQQYPIYIAGSAEEKHARALQTRLDNLARLTDTDLSALLNYAS